MKTIIVTIAAIFIIQVNNLFAHTGDPSVRSVHHTISLAPQTPSEATFDDVFLVNDNSNNIARFAPVTPIEADFSDTVPENEINLKRYAPVTPAMADFNDIDEANLPSVKYAGVAPVKVTVSDSL